MVHLSERGQEIKLNDVPTGVVVHIKTERSNWYLCRVEGSTMDNQGYFVKGVMIVTDSFAWGRITRDPFETEVYHLLRVGMHVAIRMGDDVNNSVNIKSITYGQP